MVLGLGVIMLLKSTDTDRHSFDTCKKICGFGIECVLWTTVCLCLTWSNPFPPSICYLQQFFPTWHPPDVLELQFLKILEAESSRNSSPLYLEDSERLLWGFLSTQLRLSININWYKCIQRIPPTPILWKNFCNCTLWFLWGDELQSVFKWAKSLKDQTHLFAK